VACIGPQTAATAQEHGLRVDVLSPSPDVPSLVAALAEHALAAKDEAQDPMWRPSPGEGRGPPFRGAPPTSRSSRAR